MSSIERVGVGHRLSNVVKFNGVIYLAGQVPDKIDVGFAEQTQEVLEKVERLLKEHGSSKKRILSCQIFLSDIRFITTMNEVWDTWVPVGNAPARATVEAKLANPQKLIEVCVVAATD